MRAKSRLFAAALVVSVFGLAVSAQAAEPAADTVITVGEMCGGCVKRITAKLEKMEGIGGIRCDLKTKTVVVVPEKGKVLSPRALWDAMEEIGKTPKQLAGPGGEFNSKPKA